MKICVLGLRGFPLVEGGVEKHCECLYPRLPDSIIVLRRKPYVTDEVRASSNYANIKFMDLPSTKVKGFEAAFHSFLATVRAIKEKPDVVCIHNIGPGLFTGMLTRRGIPVVITYHSPNYEHEKWNWFAKRFLKYSEKVALRNASKIIFVNRFQLERFSRDIQTKSVYIPNGIDKPVKTLDASYLHQIGVEEGKYVLAVGRITPEKGFDTLVRAFNKASHQGYKLVIAGGVEFENSYMDEIKKIAGNDVIFTGYVYGEKLNQLYSHASLFVLSSLNEGFPLVLLEAMSYNLDVLVSDIPATHLVNLDSEDYFEKGDDTALAQKISERLRNPRKRKYALDEYDWNTVAERTGEVLREAVEH